MKFSRSSINMNLCSPYDFHKLSSRQGDGSGEGVPMSPDKGASQLYVIQDPKLAGSCPQYTYVCFIIFEIAIAILNRINRLVPIMTQYLHCAVETEFQIRFAMYVKLA